MLHVILSVSLLVGAGLVLYALSTFLLLLLRQALSPLRNLPGPPSPSFFMGNLREMHDQENTNLVVRWEQQYGTTFVYRGFMGGARLMTTDPVAVAHILGRGYDYPKPEFVRDNLSNMAAGEHGLLTVEGEDHRRQRKILGPAFTSAHIKSLCPIFWNKAVELRNIWLDIASSSQSLAAPSDPFHVTQSSQTPKDGLRTRAIASTTSVLPNPFSTFMPGKATARRQNNHASPTRPYSTTGSTSEGSSARVEVLAWLACATLDVIGEAGFGYRFNSLASAAKKGDEKGEKGEKENELARAFGVIFSAARRFRVMTILQAWFPELRRFRREGAAEREARETMRRIGLSLIEKRQAEATKEQAAALHTQPTPFSATAELKPGTGHATAGRDLLSVLIRSNVSSVPTQRLSLEETLCQISTFLSAGHETSSSALTWTLYALARAPDIQAHLRRELCSIPFPPSAPHGETIAAILEHPYLDAVVRESLRLHAPVTSTMRVAGVDDVVPVARPFLDRRGRPCNAIHVRKGDIITVPVQAMNKSKEVWGDDAEIFRPERWLLGGDGREWSDEEAEERGRRDGMPGKGQKKAGTPGLWGNMLTFLNGNPLNGNRACIGFRFAINEIKIFLYVLLHDIEFSIDPTIEIEKKINVVTRPAVKSEPHMGNQMPLNLRRIASGS